MWAGAFAIIFETRLNGNLFFQRQNVPAGSSLARFGNLTPVRTIHNPQREHHATTRHVLPRKGSGSSIRPAVLPSIFVAKMSRREYDTIQDEILSRMTRLRAKGIDMRWMIVSLGLVMAAGAGRAANPGDSSAPGISDAAKNYAQQ